MSTIAAMQFARKVAHRRAVMGPRARSSALPRQVPATLIAVTYFTRLRTGILASMQRALDRRLIRRLAEIAKPAHTDASDDLPDIFDELESDIFSDFPDEQLRLFAAEMGDRISTYQKGQLKNQLKGALGAEPLIADSQLSVTMQDFVTENVNLIKSIPEEFLQDLQKKIIAGVNDGQRPEELAETIQERYGVAESRAALIARDQTGKLYGQLNAQRQTELGITEYIWRGVQDNRERDEHFEREGEKFSFDDPPEDGNPGEPINCRCYAEPVLPTEF